MVIDISECQGTISSSDLGRYFINKTGKAQLKHHVSQWLGKVPPKGQAPTPNLQQYADIYAEQVTSDPMQDLSKYFATLQGRGFTVGGVSTGFPTLAISPKDVKPSNTAISAVGEALAGWYLESKKNMVPLARPISEGPDIIFADKNTACYALVQVKATQEPDVCGRLKEAALDLLDWARNVKLMAPRTAYSAYLIGIVIKTASDYELISLRIDLI